MNRFYLLVFFVLATGFLRAAPKSDISFDEARDSVLVLLSEHSHRDTARVEALLKVVPLYTRYAESRDSGRIYAEEALLISRENGYAKGEAWALLQIGRTHNNNPNVAAGYFRRAGEIFRKIGDNNGLANTMLQNGVIMYVQNNFAEALTLFRQSLDLFKALNDEPHEARLHHLFGLTLCKTGDYPGALLNLQNALNTYIRLNREKETYECRMGLADTYYASGLYADALIYYRMCNEFGVTHDIPDMSVSALLGIGNIQMKQGEMDLAEKSFLQAFYLVEDQKNAWRSLMATDALYKYYEQAGRYSEAFRFLKIGRAMQDSLYNEKNMTAMADLKSERAITEAENALLKSNLQNESDKRIKILLVSILAVLLIVAYTSARRYRMKMKMAKRLEEKNKALNIAMNSLKAAEAQLIKAEKMAVFGKLSAGIAHEIRNPLNFITNFSELSQQIADDFVHTEDNAEQRDMALQLKKLVDKIGYHGRRADSIVTRMLQHSRSAHTEAELTDVNRLASEFSDLAYESMRNLVTNFECTLEKQFDPSIRKVWFIPQDLSRVIINLLNNAFYAVHDKKHLHLNGYSPVVIIGTHQREDNVELYVTDNGSGIPEEVKDKIFEPFFTTKPLGEGTGLGLSICADIIKAAGGQIAVSSTREEGTTFSISFPLTDHLPVQTEAQDSLRLN